MASFWDKIKQYYLQGNAVVRLIFLNIIVFLLMRLVFALMGLTGHDGKTVLDWIQLPALTMTFLERPWTLITYMFVHFKLMHLLMNMMLLYFFGTLFLRWFSERQLLVYYLIGGLSGGLFFILGYMLFPTLSTDILPAPLIGASASVMALCITITFYRPDENIPMFLFGNVKLKFIATVLIAIDLLSINKTNAGVGLAHLGGIMSGLMLGFSLKNGKDMFAWVNDFFVRKPKMKIKYNRAKSESANREPNVDQEYRNRKKRDTDRMDAILDKVKQSGYDSLSKDEKRELFDFSKK